MHPFPPLPPIRFDVVAVHVVLLLLAVGALGGVFLRRARPAKAYDAAIWFVCGMGLTALFAATTQLDEGTRRVGFGFLIFLWVVIALGVLVSLLRLNHQRDATGLAVSILSLCALTFLVAFLLPGVPDAREAAKRTQCMNRLRNAGLAMLAYRAAYDELPPHSWRVTVLPFLDQQALHERYDFTQPWDAPANRRASEIGRELYACPAVPVPTDASAPPYTAYALPTGDGLIYDGERPRSLVDLEGKQNQTLLLVEACGQRIIWTEPRDLPLAELPVGINLPGNRPGESAGLLSSYHSGVVNVLLADGSGRALSANIDPEILKLLLAVDGKERLRKREV